MKNATITPQDMMAEIESLSKTEPLKKDSGFVIKNLLQQIKRIDFEGHVYGDSTEREHLERRAKLLEGGEY